MTRINGSQDEDTLGGAEEKSQKRFEKAQKSINYDDDDDNDDVIIIISNYQ